MPQQKTVLVCGLPKIIEKRKKESIKLEELQVHQARRQQMFCQTLKLHAQAQHIKIQNNLSKLDSKNKFNNARDPHWKKHFKF